ncbi:MAG: hypothetical protein ACYDAQ_08010 [Mycobacteriales bacterium]
MNSEAVQIVHSARMLARALEVLLVGAGLILAVSIGNGSNGRTAPPPPTRGQLLAYESAITPAVRDWGSIEMLGMRPALGDLASGQGVPPAAIVMESRAWVAALGHDRAMLRAAPDPGQLTVIAAGLDQAMVDYLRAATLFGQGAGHPAARSAFLQAGVSAAMAGDSAFDDSTYLLQTDRVRLGLAISPDFPDHPGLTGAP